MVYDIFLDGHSLMAIHEVRGTWSIYSASILSVYAYNVSDVNVNIIVVVCFCCVRYFVGTKYIVPNDIYHNKHWHL